MSRGYSEHYSNLLNKQYFNFAAAHFLVFEDGEREPLHGHNYRAEVEFDTQGLDGASLVADFIRVKPLFKAACDLLDHRVLMPTRSPELTLTQDARQVVVHWRDESFSFPAKDVVLLDIENTSSELLAKFLCEALLTSLDAELPELRLGRIVVTLSESPGQSARYERRFNSEPALQATTVVA